MMQDKIKIVYTPLHGTGNIPVRKVLKELGFANVFVVKEQELPDGNFPTVSSPNPESEEAFELALKLAKEKNADIILATDPDADRLGVYVKDKLSGSYVPLTGNMSGCLLAEYKLRQLKERGCISGDGVLIKTIVTTNMAREICDYYDIHMLEVLTGFKYIGKKILEFENSGKGDFLFGFEESYGCLMGTYARDKDAIAAAMVLCEAACFYKAKNMTLWDAMLEMYEKYGYYNDDVISITLKGIDGSYKMKTILDNLRNNPPMEIGGYKVLSIRDYKEQKIRDTSTNVIEDTLLPTSDALYFDLDGGAWVCVRPSGTEPKIKLYFGVKGQSLESANELSTKLGESVSRLIES